MQIKQQSTKKPQSKNDRNITNCCPRCVLHIGFDIIILYAGGTCTPGSKRSNMKQIYTKKRHTTRKTSFLLPAPSLFRSTCITYKYILKLHIRVLFSCYTLYFFTFEIIATSLASSLHCTAKYRELLRLFSLRKFIRYQSRVQEKGDLSLSLFF